MSVKEKVLPMKPLIKNFMNNPPGGGNNGDSDPGSDQHPGPISGGEAPPPGPQNPN